MRAIPCCVAHGLNNYKAGLTSPLTGPDKAKNSPSSSVYISVCTALVRGLEVARLRLSPGPKNQL